MGASVKPETTPHILSFDEWQATQYAPHRADQTDPTKPMGQGRILTFDEWQKAQASGNPTALQFPAMPKIASDRLNKTAGTALPGQYQMGPTPEQQAGAAVRSGAAALDVAAPNFGPGGALIARAGAAVGRQVIAPAVENPAMTAAMINPVGAIIGTGMAAHTIAKYGWQVAHEQFMSPEDRAAAQADPERVSGEAAAVQAVMLGLGALAGIHGISKAADVSEGVTEAAAGDMARASAGTSPVDETFAMPRLMAGRAAVAQQSQAGIGQAAAERTAEPLTVPVVPVRGGQAEQTPVVPQAGQVEEFPSVPRVGRGREATDLTEEQRSGKVVPVVESQPFSTGEQGSRIPVRQRSATPRSYFSTPKGADVLGTAAAAHGLPETANPFPPNSPLATAWDEGHVSVTAPGEPVNRGPAALYGRLSNDALGAEYRALLEKRTTEQPNAQAPLWTPEREAAAVEAIENRRRPDGTLAAADKAKLARLQLEEGEGYYVGRHTFESAGAEQRLTAINKHIAAIEREMAGRGLDAGEIASAGGEQTDFNFGANTQPEPAGGALPPVEGTGPTRTRGVATSVEAKAVENKLGPLSNLPQYRQLNMADQATKAVHFLNDNPALARQVAMGEAPAPQGLHPEFVHIALENRATTEGDVATIDDLAHSKLTEEGTTMGQRIAAHGTRDAASPVRAIQDIEEARGARGEGSGKVTEKGAADLQKVVSKAHPDVLNESTLTKLINSLRC